MFNHDKHLSPFPLWTLKVERWKLDVSPIPPSLPLRSSVKTPFPLFPPVHKPIRATGFTVYPSPICAYLRPFYYPGFVGAAVKPITSIDFSLELGSLNLGFPYPH
jgi:hypothetical protein